MTDDEKRILLAAIVLLENGTSDSLDPVYRQSWNAGRDRVVIQLREAAR